MEIAIGALAVFVVAVLLLSWSSNRRRRASRAAAQKRTLQPVPQPEAPVLDALTGEPLSFDAEDITIVTKTGKVRARVNKSTATRYRKDGIKSFRSSLKSSHRRRGRVHMSRGYGHDDGLDLLDLYILHELLCPDGDWERGCDSLEECWDGEYGEEVCDVDSGVSAEEAFVGGVVAAEVLDDAFAEQPIDAEAATDADFAEAAEVLGDDTSSVDDASAAYADDVTASDDSPSDES